MCFLILIIIKSAGLPTKWLKEIGVLFFVGCSCFVLVFPEWEKFIEIEIA